TSKSFVLEEDGKSCGSLVFLGLRPKVSGSGDPQAGCAAVPAPEANAGKGPAPGFPSPGERRQHYFRNQLQLVTSLFGIEPQGAAARDAFLRWQIRLRSMALACPHDQSDTVLVFPLLRSLADDICSLIGRGP